jgi:transposase
MRPFGNPEQLEWRRRRAIGLSGAAWNDTRSAPAHSASQEAAIAALCLSPDRRRVRLYFRLRTEAGTDAPMAIAFLRDLSRELRAPILLVWDNLGMHRSKAMKTFLDISPLFHVRLLPPYAPELNPLENVWGYLKCNPMANFAPTEPDALLQKTRRSGRSLQRKPCLLRSFIKHCPLPLRLR